MTSAILAVSIAAAAIGLAVIARPYWGDYVHTPGAVSSQYGYSKGRGGEHCDMLVAFNVAGREYRATYDPGRACRKLPEGGAVTVSANPADPTSRIVIVEYDASCVHVPNGFELRTRGF
jgi:hypothetical protein